MGNGAQQHISEPKRREHTDQRHQEPPRPNHHYNQFVLDYDLVHYYAQHDYYNSRPDDDDDSCANHDNDGDANHHRAEWGDPVLSQPGDAR